MRNAIFTQLRPVLEAFSASDDLTEAARAKL